MPSNNFPNIGYTTWGRDHNFFQKLAVNWSTFGGGAVDGVQPDMVITFTTQGIQLLNLGTGVIEYSFNGLTVHGELNSANPTSGLVFDNRVVSKIWFRVQAGSTGPITVSVQAWSIP